MRTYSYLLASSANISASSASSSVTPTPAIVVSTSAQSIEYAVNYSIQAIYRGIQPQGTFSVLGSNYVGGPYVALSGSSTFINAGLPGSSSVQSTSGTVMWNVPDAAYQYIKLQFLASTGSSGNLESATLFAKGWK